MGRAERNANKKKKKWPKYVGITFLVLLLAIGGYAFYLYQSLATTVGKMHDERGPSGLRTKSINLKNGEPISVLVMGVDQREGDKGRADTLILLTVNPNSNSMQMTSIPRDTRVELVSRDENGKLVNKGQDKINHSFAFGGADMTINTVEKFLDVPVDFFVEMNMEGLQQIVDSLGGIQVENTLAFSYDGFDFPVGTLNLNGQEALSYARMRYEDPKGDFGRQDRQRQVISGIIDEAVSPAILTKMDDIFETMGGNMTTNMSFDEMKIVQAKYKDARKNVETFTMQGTGQTIGGVWYFIVPEEERQAVSSRVKQHLEIE
ncbi:LCP family protein [Fredinandcohnia sp. 179-A 10B2 NHS]|uniref:LCP family glycopolymer transferase n=1 Tax=Fredinandcohnia sp. 179-A 10B2 NHS TaxID=3235176 RepID=UPI0039A2DDEC